MSKGARYLSLSFCSVLCSVVRSLPYVLRTTSVAARKQASPSARASLLAQRAAAVIIIFCSHGAFSPVFPCRRRRRRWRRRRRRRSLSLTPLARTRNSLCCLHIFSTISLAVGRTVGSSLENALAKTLSRSYLGNSLENSFSISQISQRRGSIRHPPKK